MAIPSAPYGLQASSSINTIRLNWLPSASGDATSYTILIDGTFFASTTNLSTNEYGYLEYMMTGLTAGTAYPIQIYASNSSGDSALSTLLPVSTSVANPATQASSYSQESTSITLTWKEPTTGADSFKIFKDSVLYTTVATTAEGYSTSYNNYNSITVSGLNAATAYSFDIVTVAGSLESSPVNITGRTGPATQSPPSVSAVSSTTVTLTWADVPDADTYVIYEPSLVGGAKTSLSNSVTITGLSQNTTYNFALQAKHLGLWEGPISTTTQVATPMVPIPTNVRLTSIPTTTSLSIAWDVVDNADYYDIRVNGSGYKTQWASTTYTLNNLTPNTDYSIDVRAWLPNGEGGWDLSNYSEPLITATAVNNPSGLYLTSITETSCGLAWTSPDGGAAYYRIDFDAAEENTKTVTTSATSYTMTGLVASKDYTVTLTAYNPVGHPSNPIQINVLTLPFPPTITGTEIRAASILLQWSEVETATSYELNVNVNNSSIAVYTGITNLFFNVPELLPDTIYDLILKAVNSSGKSQATITSLATLPLLDTPTNIDVADITSTSLLLSWSSVPNATSYEVYLNGDLTNTSVTNSQSITGLLGGETYALSVKAISANSFSNLSNSINVITVPNPPTNLIQTSITSTSVSLSWTSSLGADTYNIYVDGNLWDTSSTSTKTITGLTSNTSYDITIKAINTSGESTSASILTALTLPLAPVTLTVNNVTVNTLDLSWTAPINGADSYNVYKNGVLYGNVASTAINITGLVGNTSYNFAIRSLNATGESLDSEFINQLTLPSVPQNVTAIATSDSATISWNPPTTNADSYNVYQDGVFVNNVLTSPNTITNLMPNTNYDFMVKSVNETGESAGNIATTLTLLNSPTNLIETNSHPTGFDLTWDAVADATSYEVYLNSSLYNTTTANSISFSGLVENAIYNVTVKAVSATNESAMSSTYTTTTASGFITVDAITKNTVDLSWDNLITSSTEDVLGLCTSSCAIHTLAVKADASVVAWGDNNFGQCDVPTGLTGVRQAVASRWNSLALKTDGTVVAWGSNDYGQCDVPTGLTGVKKIAAGQDFCLALKAIGNIVAWGDNTYGQCDVPFTELLDIKQIVCGNFHSLALMPDNTVVAWGRNDYGQCNVPTGLTGVKKIAAGPNHSLALKTDGTVVAWGRNDYGQCDVPTGLTGVIDITGGFFRSMALKADNTIVGWGSDYNGAINNIPAELTNVISLQSNYFYNYVLHGDGSITGFGYEYAGLGDVPDITVLITSATYATCTLYQDGIPIQTMPNDILSTSVVGLSANSDYNFKVYQTSWNESESATLIVNILTLPDAPLNSIITDTKTNDVVITWDTPPNGADSYKIKVNGVEVPATITAI